MGNRDDETAPTEAEDRARRAAIHRALGDPVRLAIVDLLARSDLAPSEIEREVGIHSNLLAHHLRVLEELQLIVRTPSQGDRRRRYLSLQPEARAVVGIEQSDAPKLEVERVLFVCTRNSARSPLAAALWEQAGPRIPATSAGTEPSVEVHPLAVWTGRRAGLPMQHRPQHLDGVATPGDLVVTVCDRAHEDPATRNVIASMEHAPLHWSVPDPVMEGIPDAFERTVEQLRVRIHQLAHALRPQVQEAS